MRQRDHGVDCRLCLFGMITIQRVADIAVCDLSLELYKCLQVEMEPGGGFSELGRVFRLYTTKFVKAVYLLFSAIEEKIIKSVTC